MSVCVCVCFCVFLCVLVRILAMNKKEKDGAMDTFALVQVCMYVYMCVCVYVYMCTFVVMHTCIHTYIRYMRKYTEFIHSPFVNMT